MLTFTGTRSPSFFTTRKQFILTVTENGFGKRSSAYEYRRTNRGGQGITNIDTAARNGCVVASFPARQGEQLMLVTDQGKMIRTTVGDIRIAGRNTMGVTNYKDADGEHVVCVAAGDRGILRRRRSRSMAAKSLRPLPTPLSVKASLISLRTPKPDRPATRHCSQYALEHWLDIRLANCGWARQALEHDLFGSPPGHGREGASMRRAAATAAAEFAFSQATSLEEEFFMPLPHSALVLVADGRKMLFFHAPRRRKSDRFAHR